MKHFDQTRFETASAAPILTTEAYVQLLHPEDAIGKTTLMAKDATGRAHSRTYTLTTASVLANNFLDGDGYISLNRFHGPRKISQLAALNGLFLDLDVDRLPPGASRSVGAWSLDVMMHCLTMKLPQPSVLLSTGRGLAAIWLIKPLPPKALPRWQEAQNVLIEHFRSLGADPACRDAARITRLPGSLNSKSQKIASIIDGTLERYDFDRLADEIYIAAGRPTRKELKHRQVCRKQRTARKQSGGLPVRARFSAVLRDLDRLRLSWGGQVPVGARNTWLHLYATCLSHIFDSAEIPGRVQAMAAEATPGLFPVRSVRRSKDRGPACRPPQKRHSPLRQAVSLCRFHHRRHARSDRGRSPDTRPRADHADMRACAKESGARTPASPDCRRDVA